MFVKSRPRNRSDLFDSTCSSFWAHSTNECQRLCPGKTKHGPVHDVPDQNSFDFADYRHIWKVLRFVEDGLPFRCRDRLELTLVFEARDFNSVIQQTITSGIWRNSKLKTKETPFCEECMTIKSSESPPLSIQRRTEYGFVLQRTISDTRSWIVFLFGLCNTLLWLWTTRLEQKSWLLKTTTLSVNHVQVWKWK